VQRPPAPTRRPELPLLSPLVRTLVLAVAAIGFLFDTYELLMFPAMGADGLAELMGKTNTRDPAVTAWIGRTLWIAALCGGVFGLLGGWLIDRLGRKTVMAGSIFLYSFSPLAAAFSTELWMLVFFRCTTFIGVCVEMVAAVTWLAELFHDKRTREKAIAWTLATASVGGILVTAVYSWIVQNAADLPALPVPDRFNAHAPWRYTLLTGLIPGALILILLPFVPESEVWRRKKLDGTLKRPSFGELFSPALVRTTVVTTILSACGYAAAFGALQMTPSVIAAGLPDVVEKEKVVKAAEDAKDPDAGKMRKEQGQFVQARRGSIQLWQELGGLAGRIALAVLLMFLPAKLLLRLFLVPGILLFPLTYLNLVTSEYLIFAVAIFFCGLLTVAQFSYLSEFLPKVFPLHLRGTGGSFATNVGGRMLGTMAAVLNTEALSPLFSGARPMQVATAAAVIGGSVYLIAFIASFWLPAPAHEDANPPGPSSLSTTDEGVSRP
ncbi:MAG TPA: MFS transporter, partial [Gemmataceae bacterium]|nr:MFS transporter [Gemmataceae bacterium]